MSTIEIRKMKKESWRIRIRLAHYPIFQLTFSRRDDAENWIRQHEHKYIAYSEHYQNWIKANRKSLRENGIFHEHIPLDDFLLAGCR